MNVGSICQSEAITISAAETVTAAARVMRERHVGFLIVIENPAPNGDRKVSGVLTDRDIVTTVLAKEADARTLKVGDIMTRNPLLISESYPLQAALRHMRDTAVRRVPVIGARDQLVGVLSMDDVLQALASEISDLVQAIRNQQRLERSARP